MLITKGPTLAGPQLLPNTGYVRKDDLQDRDGEAEIGKVFTTIRPRTEGTIFLVPFRVTTELVKRDQFVMQNVPGL